jgi:phospholipid/cholesterol/gamma-HCH transport system substrate-binding protein
LFNARTYHAEFSEAGGIASGDTVYVSGVAIGKVGSVDLVDDHVDVGFEINESAVTVGDQTRASIRAQTALGKQSLQLVPAGPGELPLGGAIPIERTTPPYDITDALSELTKTIGDTQADRLAESLNTVSGVLDRSAPQLRPALDGVRRLSAVINSRDAELSELLVHSANVTGVLAERSGQIQTVLRDGSTLLGEVDQRRDDLARLIRQVSDLGEQLSGLSADNRRQIGPILDQLNGALQLLRNNKDNLDKVLRDGPATLRQLGETFGDYPGATAYIPNFALPTNLLAIVPGATSGGGR